MWGEIELEPEVRKWLTGLPDEQFGQVEYSIDRLSRDGPLLSEPHSRQLRGKVRELRLGIDGESWRITYYIATGRRIILLTVFRKQSAREPREIARALRAYRTCVEAGHTAEG
jgi:hypothetical protein